MLKLESEVNEFAQLVADKMLRSAGKEQFDVKEAFNCFTADGTSTPSSRPEEERSMYRLSGEGFNFLLAGTETTAGTLTAITYYLLAQPATYKTRMKDLQGLEPSNLKWTDLEQRPYLWAVIQESLRMMPGVSHRPARIARDEDLVYKSRDGSVQWVIPRGTPIGMTSMINHWNKELFMNPDEFVPERWLVDGQPNYKLQKMLISLGKGSRSCIGEK
ncbi:hypothetical protein FQN52_000321 [Onygenales sp. PD_12]|nr:hypothetical protein FQN52_000321 [Onygenales sp. PD_12]